MGLLTFGLKDWSRNPPVIFVIFGHFLFGGGSWIFQSFLQKGIFKTGGSSPGIPVYKEFCLKRFGGMSDCLQIPAQGQILNMAFDDQVSNMIMERL